MTLPFKILLMRGGGGGGGGGGSSRVQLISTTVYGLNPTSGVGSATISFHLNGGVGASWNPQGSVSPGTFNWRLSGASADYDIMATLGSGTTPSGTLGAWLNLSTTRTWTLSASNDFNYTCRLAVQIRDAVTLTVLAGPVNFYLDATGGTQ
jgi:hypothetical protein